LADSISWPVKTREINDAYFESTAGQVVRDGAAFRFAV
jgi:hypothetical protein